MSGMSPSSDWQGLRQQISELINSGQTNAVETALSDRLDQPNDEQLVLKCIDWEVSLRASRGETPEIGEYLRRFPDHAPQLSSRWNNRLSRSGQTLNPSASNDQETVEKRPQDGAPQAGSNQPERLSSFLRKLDDLHAAEPQSDVQKIQEQLLQMHQDGLLTKFQAELVASGRVKSLILGGYTILDQIGAGGMGEVFKAEHRRMARTVAIKTLSSAVTQDAEATARFEREARLAAKLLHNNIVTAFDADQFNGVRFLVMEYVEGQDLAALAEKIGPLPPLVAINYALQAARGLECAHNEGVIHRDIKPANLLLDKKGVVKILDMGIARIQVARNAAMRSELTLQGDVFGTVEFMSPEQSFDTKNVDGRSDIYSLGCTLYYLITGRPMFEGDTVLEKILAHRERPIPSLRSFNSDIPAEIDALFKRMVAKRLQDRFRDTKELVTSLSRFSQGEPLPADQIRNHIPSRFKTSRVVLRKTLLRTFAAIFLTIAGAAGVVSFMRPVNGLIPTIQVHETTNLETVAQNPDSDPTTAIDSLISIDVTTDQPERQVSPLTDETPEPALNVGAGKEPDIVDELELLTEAPPMTPSRGDDVAPSGDAAISSNSASLPSTSSEPQPQAPESEQNKTESAAATSEKFTATASGITDLELSTIAQKSAMENAKKFQESAENAATRPPEEQLQVVMARLQELNPNFDGRETHHIEGGVVTELKFISDNVIHISPVRALTGLKSLNCSGSGVKRGKVSDLSPLSGMNLNVLAIQNTQVSSLRPLQGMKLTSLDCAGTLVFDLRPLRGMDLKDLKCARTQITSLKPLSGMAILYLDCSDTRVEDLSPLLDCKYLKNVKVKKTKTTLDYKGKIEVTLWQCAVELIDPVVNESPPAPPPAPQP